MFKKDVIDHYGSSTKVAEVLGMTRQGVEKWGRAVPEGVAYKLQVITRGKLRVRPEEYESNSTTSAA